MIELGFLFVYGTLLDKDNKFAVYLKANSRFISSGKVKGKLYDIGAYPGAILVGNEEYIHGSILQLNDPEKVLSVIDDYEGFGTDQPQPNEFIRVLNDVETKTGEISCWIYVYNWPVNGLPQITAGKFLVSLFIFYDSFIYH